MGVRLRPSVTFDQLAQELEESGFFKAFKYKDRSHIVPLEYELFSESDGMEAFQSTVSNM